MSEYDRRGAQGASGVLNMKFIHPETGKEHDDTFIAFAVSSMSLAEHNHHNLFAVICLHRDYGIAKAEFDIEVERQKNANNKFSKAVEMIYMTKHGYYHEGLVVHKWEGTEPNLQNWRGEW